MEPPPGADPGHPMYEIGAAAVRGGIAAHRGFEPRLARSERAVLPVGRMGIERVGAARLELATAVFWGRPLLRWRTRPCAARDSNSVPRIKRPVHHQSCLQRAFCPARREISLSEDKVLGGITGT